MQTYLCSGATAINAFGAWDITTGASNVVVAVVDTGYRPHAGLAGRFLLGYDFVSDPRIANDGDGRDADASHLGDWLSEAEKSGPFKGHECSVSNSTWHGTAVSDAIAGTPT